ncbi:MAG: hypothetical protein IPL03_13635 [Sterolibacteriaceae bacterium]|nr:hypothetical protein [Candidatus Methylophosphatis haderslevensis]
MAPNIPLDLRLEFWNVVPQDQVVKPYLEGGEQVRTAGLFPPMTACCASSCRAIRCWLFLCAATQGIGHADGHRYRAGRSGQAPCDPALGHAVLAGRGL